MHYTHFQGSAATRLRCGGNDHFTADISAECSSETVAKIGQYLTKLKSCDSQWLTFQAPPDSIMCTRRQTQDELINTAQKLKACIYYENSSLLRTSNQQWRNDGVAAALVTGPHW